MNEDRVAFWSGLVLASIVLAGILIPVIKRLVG